MVKAFLSYVRENSTMARKLADDLRTAGIDVWFDQTHLKPGDRWADVISREITAGDFFLACFSCESVARKEAFMNEELTQAIARLRRLPTDRRWFIPIRLSECEIPVRRIGPGETLRAIHRLDLFRDWSLGVRQLVAIIEPVEIPQMILIPGGPCIIGSDPRFDRFAQPEEQPQHTQQIAPFAISKTPVTQAQYYPFFMSYVESKPGVPVSPWPSYWALSENDKSLPATWIQWFGANAYCDWLSRQTGRKFELPSEIQWEMAARGPQGLIYPWGNQWRKGRCSVGALTPVGAFPLGASPFGVLDMSGNVWEWTKSEFRDYPYDATDGRENWISKKRTFVVIKGGSALDSQRSFRCAERGKYASMYAGENIGFRIVEALQ